MWKSEGKDFSLERVERFPGFDQAIVLYGNNKESLVAKMAKVHMNEYGFTNIFVLEDGLEGVEGQGSSG